jgi:hypothetical protein
MGLVEGRMGGRHAQKEQELRIENTRQGVVAMEAHLIRSCHERVVSSPPNRNPSAGCIETDPSWKRQQVDCITR